MRQLQSPGMDGWNVGELKLLPAPLLDLLAEMFNGIERSGKWPRPLECAMVSLISKGAGCEPNDLRPITVMSVVYRVWAIRRLQNLRTWQEKWASEAQFAYRSGRSPLEPLWHLSLQIESSLLEDKPLYGISFDYSKCFDNIPHNILLNLVGSMGMASRILRPVTGMYKQLRRRFKVAGGIGKEFSSTNGIPQGCPVSVVLLNALLSVWTQSVENEIPEACPSAFADDTGATVSSRGALQKVADLTKEFADLTGQTLSTGAAGKSFAFRTDGGRNTTIRLGGIVLPWRVSAKQLGVHVHFRKQHDDDREAEKLDLSAAAAAKVAWLPLGLFGRSIVLQTMVLSRSSYGSEVVRVPKKSAARLRSAVLRCLWGVGRRLRCKEILFTLFMAGHRLDPCQIDTYKCLVALRRVLVANPRFHKAFEDTWVVASRARNVQHGPVGKIFLVTRLLGWRWVGPWRFTTSSNQEFDFLCVSEQRWQHEIRDSLRSMLWTAASQRRPDMVGLEAGVDRMASSAVLQSKKLSDNQRGMLRSILAGEIFTEHRRWRAKLTANNECKFCLAGEVENEQHLWWECPAWASVRAGHPKAMLTYSDNWPTCFRWCGIMPENHEGFSELAEWFADQTAQEKRLGGTMWPQSLCQVGQPRCLRTDELSFSRTVPSGTIKTLVFARLGTERIGRTATR
ncbi:unnamed protein product [Polarella glacialis]|uniref:Reverse transcriptase domain-containing protein n=1 Tax=Polarella glacialis TaxID=89957 RepID=A0A813GDX7_POLGL|nr:unnamed protein product [Polarella glacialis]